MKSAEFYWLGANIWLAAMLLSGKAHWGWFLVVAVVWAAISVYSEAVDERNHHDAEQEPVEKI